MDNMIEALRDLLMFGIMIFFVSLIFHWVGSWFDDDKIDEDNLEYLCEEIHEIDARVERLEEKVKS